MDNQEREELLASAAFHGRENRRRALIYSGILTADQVYELTDDEVESICDAFEHDGAVLA